jgi:hypothetical protein
VKQQSELTVPGVLECPSFASDVMVDKGLNSRDRGNREMIVSCGVSTLFLSLPSPWQKPTAFNFACNGRIVSE